MNGEDRKGPELEEHEEEQIGRSPAWFANIKRSYDTYQRLDLTSADRLQRDLDADGEQRRRHTEDIHNLTMQLMQNAIETANMVGKQAVRHGDIAIDRQWNLDEVSQLAAGSNPAIDAIAAAIAANADVMAAAIADTLSKQDTAAK